MPTTYIDDHIEISSGRLTIRTRSRTREALLTDVRSARLINRTRKFAADLDSATTHPEHT